MIMKKYQRATKNEIESFLLRNNQVKIQPELFNNIYDTDGKIVANVSRKNELTGAGIEYVTSYVEYICTHFKTSVGKTNSKIYYEAPPIEWEAFLDIVTGGIPGLRDRAAKEILRLHANPKPVLIRRNDGHVVSMQPFVLTFDWGKPETLGARAAANLARMQEGAAGLARKRESETAKKENRPFNIDNIKFSDLLPIETITVQFSKPLFDDFFRKRGLVVIPSLQGCMRKCSRKPTILKIALPNTGKNTALPMMMKYLNLTKKRTYPLIPGLHVISCFTIT